MSAEPDIMRDLSERAERIAASGCLDPADAEAICHALRDPDERPDHAPSFF